LLDVRTRCSRGYEENQLRRISVPARRRPARKGIHRTATTTAPSAANAWLNRMHPWGLWCKRQDLARYDVGRAAGGVGMGKLMGVEQLFEGRHFDREVIILCVRW
jgi:hypothetical protein